MNSSKLSLKQPIKQHIFSVQCHIGFVFMLKVDAISLIDAMGLLSLSCHLVSHYFINVLVASVSLRSVRGLANQIYTVPTYKLRLGRNATVGTSDNDHNGLCSFKCAVSSTADTAEDRQTGRWT